MSRIFSFGLRAEKTDIAIRCGDRRLNVLDIAGFAVRTDHEPGDAFAQFIREAGQCGKGKVMPFASREPRDRDDDEPVRRQMMRLANRGSVVLRGPNQKSDTPSGIADASLRIDGKAFAEQVAGISAVGGDLVRGPKTPAPRIARRLSGVWVSLISVP